MRSRLWIVVVVLLIVPVTFAQKRNITEKDLFSFNWIADPQVSPDGARIAFVKVTVNDRKDGYNTAIWIVSTANGETKQLTSGTRDNSPRWSPDGKYLAFVRVPETAGRPDAPQLFMISMDGGEAWQFTTLPRGAGGLQWSPDGKMISFGNGATADAQEALERGNVAAARRDAERARRFAPWAAAPWRLLGEAELAEGRLEPARRHLLRVVREDPASWDAWRDLALVSQGQEREAALRRARLLDPLAPP